MMLAIPPWLLGLGLMLGGCTTVKKGVVVGKGSRVDLARYSRVENYWVDVRGPDADGEKVTDRVLVFKKDWEKISKGDRIAPADFGALDLSATAQKLAKRGMLRWRKQRPEAQVRTAPARKPPRIAANRPPSKKVPKKPAPTAEPDFRAVEARAHEDASVREAKRKIHAAATPEEQARAWEEYRSTLHKKMRELAPTLRIDKVETGGTPRQPD